MNRFGTLDRFHLQSWDLLLRAAQSSNDPMRTPMMATMRKGISEGVLCGRKENGEIIG